MTQKKIKLKTINNQQLVGTGNITIESGSNIDIITSTNGWESTLSDSKVASEKLVKNSLDNKLDKVQSSNKGKNVVTNASTGAIEFEDKPTIPSSSSDLSDGSDLVKKSNTNGLIKNDGSIDTSAYLTSSSLSNYVQKSNTTGLLKNDGTVDASTYLTQHQNISGKEDTSNKVTSWSNTLSDSHYPSEKLVKNTIDNNGLCIADFYYDDETKEIVINTCNGRDSQGISTKEDLSNKVTTLSSSSTDSQYPSAKCVYDEIRSKEIPANADLDDYTTEGMYWCPLNATAQTLSNCPVTHAFSLLVEKNGAYGDGCKQTITTYIVGSNSYSQMHYRTMNSNDGVGSWKLLYQDTGWWDVDFATNFGNYNTDNRVQYRRVGKIVTLRGIAKNTNAVTISSVDTIVNVATISNTTCRPSMPYRVVQQGSGMNRFTLTVGTDGVITLARHGTTSATNVGAGSWLNMSCTFMVD